jgi:cobalt/nickel transport system permease protein
MHHDFLDRFSRLDSPVHRLPAALKMAAALVCILIVVITPLRTIYPFPVVAFLLILVIALSRVPALFFLKRLLVFEPFVIVVAAASLLQPGGGMTCASIIIKSTLSLTTVLLVSNTTPFTELLGVLRRIHTPPAFLTLIALMYRYVFVLIDEMQRMKRARLSRTFVTRGMGSWRSISVIIGQLFLRSTERAERIFAAMSARGWR